MRLFRRRRELFIVAGVVEIAGEGALDQIEAAGRVAVRDAGQELIDASVAPAEDAGLVMIDLRLRGDEACAVAAFERWQVATAEAPGVGRFLRTWLRGSRLDREWIDDGYQARLLARYR